MGAAFLRKRVITARGEWLNYFQELQKLSGCLLAHLDFMSREVSEYISVGQQEIAQVESAIFRQKERANVAQRLLSNSAMSRGDFKVEARTLLSEPDGVVAVIPVSSPHPTLAFSTMLETLRALCQASVVVTYDSWELFSHGSCEPWRTQQDAQQGVPTLPTNPKVAEVKEVDAMDLNSCVITGEEPPRCRAGVWGLTEKKLRDKLRAFVTAATRYDLTSVRSHTTCLEKLRDDWIAYEGEVRKEVKTFESQIRRREDEIITACGRQLVALNGHLNYGPSSIRVSIPSSPGNFDNMLNGFRAFLDDIQVVRLESNELHFINEDDGIRGSLHRQVTELLTTCRQLSSKTKKKPKRCKPRIYTVR